MDTLKRFNTTTGRTEYFIEPKGYPGYWSALGHCDRCYPYNKCLGLAVLSEDEWKDLENMLAETKNSLEVEEHIESIGLQKCSER